MNELETLVLGAGYVGRAVGGVLVGRHDGDHVVPVFDAALQRLVGPRTHVVVTFPPDGETDARVGITAPAITYVSSTGVYGDRRGVIDDATPVTTAPNASAARRLEAEAIWRARGATVLRAPAIYGPDRGLHVRIAKGLHAIPGDGGGHVSRIHVDDLAQLVRAAPRAPGETFVVGDEEPLTHLAIATRIAARLGVPVPPFAPLTEVPESLRGDRGVDGSRALRVLGVTLRHPRFAYG